ncbi:hypothetical protein M501DRAFT_1016389 [Patellaria atrata CBS 101060]|uniref:Uncharacterized protein n=1 Tax=Patellaria atrata CBS 101060 TaxID=1346257 RepID=A0A9P4VRE7_9PEZI|nr:hypothetical protein M501DRAFT_1016389 [Patellaria atrata CBS 101060]
MFRNFSFEAASRHPSDLDAHLYMDISPTSTPYLPGVPSPRSLPMRNPPISITELSDRFNEHSIHREPNYTSYFDIASPSSGEISPQYASFTHSRRSSFTYTALSPTALRLQRQRNTRLQCDDAHVRDITSLVERMIDVGDQCVLSSPTSSTTTSSSASSSDDEAPADDFARTRRASTSVIPSHTLRFRRSGDLRTNQERVMKSQRKRKYPSRRKVGVGK